MAETFAPWDAADYIKTEEDARRLLKAATDEDPRDGTVIRAVLKYIARARSMSGLARDAELNRAGLYRALSEDGNPTLSTLLKITRALGLRLRIEPIPESPLSGAAASPRPSTTQTP